MPSRHFRRNFKTPCRVVHIHMPPTISALFLHATFCIMIVFLAALSMSNRLSSVSRCKFYSRLSTIGLLCICGGITTGSIDTQLKNIDSGIEGKAASRKRKRKRKPASVSSIGLLNRKVSKRGSMWWPVNNRFARRLKKQRSICISARKMMDRGGKKNRLQVQSEIVKQKTKSCGVTYDDGACGFVLNLRSGASPDDAHAFFMKSC